MIAVLLLFCLSSLPAIAQNMIIASFKMDETDQTANVSPTMKRDINGDKTALIKIITTQKNFSFDVGPLGVTATEWQNSEHPGEIWLYVPAGVLRITIQHPQLGTIKDFVMGQRLQQGRTYIMELDIMELDSGLVDRDAQIYDNGELQGKGQTEKINNTLTDFCDATIFSNPTAFISVNGKPEGRTPYRVDRIAGNYHIDISLRGYTTYSKTLYLDGNTPDITIRLHRNYIRSNEFYMQIGGNIMPYPAMNFGIGGYIKNVNLECNYILGFTKSKKIYWNDKSGETFPFSARYKPSGGNFKAGYGIKLFSRMRITPQIGFQFVSLSESAEESLIPDDYTQGEDHKLKVANGSKAGSLTFGARFNVALAPCLGISVTPEYLLCIGKSNGFKALSEASKLIKDYAEGFGCNISVNLFF